MVTSGTNTIHVVLFECNLSYDLQVKEWLCLTCQMQRTAGSQPGQPQSQPNKILPQASQQKEKTSVSPSPENKSSVIAEAGKKKGDTSPSKSASPPKGEQIKEESSFFGFGFGGARSRSPSPQTAVSDKVFGFGSSFLSSASNLISSAGQDESSSKTPATSRKGSTVSQTSNKTSPTPPTSRKGSVAPPDAKQKLPEGESKPSAISMQEQKPLEKTPDPELAKPPHATEELCPLCKEILKKDPQNYSSCSSCKKFVCNLCGFNPNPHQTEVPYSNIFSSYMFKGSIKNATRNYFVYIMV